MLAAGAQFLAVGAVLWLIWPLRVGPVYYSEVSIVKVEGLGVLPMLFAPSALILGGTVALYMWATRGSRMARWGAWSVAVLLMLFALATSMSFGLFFLPAAVVMVVAVVLQGRIYREGI